MNAVEIEEAVSRLASEPFDAENFPFAFLEAFGNKPTTIKRLRSEKGGSNQSDLGGVLQRNHIHLKVCDRGLVGATLAALRESRATAKCKVRFVLATDGADLEAENLIDGETIACVYERFADYFGFFLPLAGITTVQQIRENAFDIKATGRLNRLYLELLKDNPDWATAERRSDLNQLMARLIFCFFAEDTNIFHGEGLFTRTIAQMSAPDGSNVAAVLAELFRAMRTPIAARAVVGIRSWANQFPYVNGKLFGESPLPLAPSPKLGEGGQDGGFTPLSQSGRGVGGEGVTVDPLPLVPSPKLGEGGQDGSFTPLSQSGRGVGGEGEYWEIPHELKKKMTEVARQFRKEPTRSEVMLWQALRGRKLDGRKFRRQQPIGMFVVDFFCGAERLIVEVDGGVHQSQQEADRQRQELLESLGLRFVRLSSELVETNLDQALVVIRQGFSPLPLAPSPKLGVGGQDGSFTPLSQSGSGVGGEGVTVDPLPLAPSPKLGEGGQDGSFTPLSQSGSGVGGEGDVPRFSKVARSYLLHVGSLDWTRINPDIFGSMIQAVADEAERGALGMHYTSVPNILKVLNPLFLDDLRSQLEAAGTNARKLLSLRQRLAKIRVFDPACGSGNFLVIAYKEMRAIEAEVNQRRGEGDRKSDIPLTNFRGIEIRSFAAEIARLALIIAEYQCDVLYRGSYLALLEFLPLKSENWITCGNALQLNWLDLCPPTGKKVTVRREDLDLWQETADQAEIEFQNEGGETYICGNPPYVGSQWRSEAQQEDMKQVFSPYTKTYRDLDYVACWFILAMKFLSFSGGRAAFVATKSICQGVQVSMLWSILFKANFTILFAYRPFDWRNLATANAGVTCIIVGIGKPEIGERRLFEGDQEIRVKNIGPYLIPMPDIIVKKSSIPINGLPMMDYGNKPSDGGHLIFTRSEARELMGSDPETKNFLKQYLGAQEFTRSTYRYCLWIHENNLSNAFDNPIIRDRIEAVKLIRKSSKGIQSQSNSSTPYRFVYTPHQEGLAIVVPSITSSNREYLPCGITDDHTIASNKCAVIYNAKIWLLAIIASSLHLQWIASVCVRMRNDFSYSNTLGWNTFPVPTLTQKNKDDLTRCAEDILLAREEYFPATIAEMYDPKRMDQEFPLVREAHDRNDETIERIYIGRRFKNDTERLEKLFDMYTKMTSKQIPR